MKMEGRGECLKKGKRGGDGRGDNVKRKGREGEEYFKKGTRGKMEGRERNV